MHLLKKLIKENYLLKTMKSEFNRKPVRFLRTKKMYLPLEDETVSNLKPAALPRTKILRKTQ